MNSIIAKYGWEADYYKELFRMQRLSNVVDFGLITTWLIVTCLDLGYKYGLIRCFSEYGLKKIDYQMWNRE